MTAPTPAGEEMGKLLERAREIAADDVSAMTASWVDTQAFARALLSSPRVEEVRREALEEAAKVADEAQATAREEIAEEKAEEGYDPYAFGSGFLGGELTAAVNIAKAIRALKEAKP